MCSLTSIRIFDHQVIHLPALSALSTSLTKLLSTLTVKNLDDFKCYELIPKSSSTNNGPRFTNNGTKSGLMPVRAKSMEARLQQPLDGMAKRQCLAYWNKLFSELHGLQTESSESNLAILWGSINEDSASVTYLNKFCSQNKGGAVVKETGIWFLKDDKNQNWLGSSPDGIIEQDGISKTVIKIKCPFIGGKPVPYKNVCVNRIPQIMLEMFDSGHQHNNANMSKSLSCGMTHI